MCHVYTFVNVCYKFSWAVVVVSGRKVEYLIEGEGWKDLPDLNDEHHDSASIGMDGNTLVVAGGTNRKIDI